MKTKENGVTLIALVTTIIILLILVSIGTAVGTSTIESAAFTKFKSELKVIQNKINELNQDSEKNIGQDLSEEQKNILDIDVISKIIYKAVLTDDEKLNIQNGFRYCDKKCIQNDLGLDSVDRDYLINIEYRYVVAIDGFEYGKTIYYMIDQIEDEIYNVRYNDKNEKSGSFELNTTKENNKCKIEISNIIYNGYVEKWQVKYKLEESSYWETSNDLTFYLKEEGTYSIKVVHGDEIDLGTKSIKISYDGLIADKVKNEIIKIGDYVQYIPDTVSTTDTSYTTLISEFETYSGSTANTTSTLTQESSLNWRVLDIKDGKVRLISELPTTSKITLSGAKGYNNAVYLIDKTCSTLYNNSIYAEKVQNLKIEDIQEYLTYNYTQYENSYVDTGKYGGTQTYTSYKKYPNLFAKEKNGWVNGIQGTELELSEQTNPIDEDATQAETSIKVKQTFWKRTMIVDDFSDKKYYQLFIKGESSYEPYWIASRSVNAYSDNAGFGVSYVLNSSSVDAYNLYYSGGTNTGKACAIRPIITLNTDVQIDTADVTKDGSEAENAWILKSE